MIFESEFNIDDNVLLKFKTVVFEKDECKIVKVSFTKSAVYYDVKIQLEDNFSYILTNLDSSFVVS